jgi:cytochrome c oxidase subunit 2
VPIRTVITALLATTALVLAGLWVGQGVNLLPLAASSNAPTYDALFRVLFSIGTTLFLGIVIVLGYSLVRFRRRSGDSGDGVALEGNLLLEIVWTAIPAVVILFVGIYSYDIYERMGGMVPLMDHAAMDHMAMDHDAMATPQKRIWGGIGPGASASTTASSLPTMPVDVTAMQFAFIFHYPEGDITSGELHVPLRRDPCFLGAGIPPQTGRDPWPAHRALLHPHPGRHLSGDLCRALRPLSRGHAHLGGGA